MAENLAELLDSYNAVTLRAIADANDIHPPEGKQVPKAEMVRLLVDRLFTRERVLGAWQALSPADRDVLERLLLQQGETDRWTLRRMLRRAGLVAETPTQSPRYGRSGVSYDSGYIGNPQRADSRVLEDILARLTRRGLVFTRVPASTYGQNVKLTFHPGATVLIPDAVRNHLPTPSPAALRRTPGEPERTLGGDPQSLLRDLYLYWDWVRKNETPIIQTGLVGKRSLKAINQILLEPDPRLDEAKKEFEAQTLYMLRQLLMALNLLTSDDESLYPTDEDPLAVPAFWDLPPLAQRGELLSVWPLTDEDSLGTEAIPYMPRYRMAREVLIAKLSAFSVGQWLDPEDLLDAALRDARGFLFDSRTPANAYSYTYAGDVAANAARMGEEIDDWSSAYVRHCLEGFLRMIGLVDVGYRGETVSAFRLTEEAPALLRAAAWDASETEEDASAAEEDAPGAEEDAPQNGADTSPDEGQIIIQPNFQILAMGPVPLGRLARLDIFADRTQADRAAMEYRLTRDSAYRSLRLGMGAAEVIDLLREISDTDIPQNVLRSLEEWGAHQERIVFRMGISLLQTADPALLESLARPEASGLRPVTPNVALLDPAHQEGLIALLLERGLLPAIGDTQPASSEASVSISPEGVIRSVHAVPGLHVRGRLDQFAEPVGPREWRLTPESVARGAGGRERVNALIAELGRLQRGPLPDGLAERLRTWGGYYGRAALQDVTLVEFEDLVSLQEILAFPEVRRLLTPLTGQGDGRALAIVKEGQRERLERLLAERGVRLDGRIAP